MPLSTRASSCRKMRVSRTSLGSVCHAKTRGVIPMPYLSHSQCEMVSQCMRRYFLTKIEGAPQAPSESLILGSSIHTALEADGLDLMTGYSPLPIEALWSHFLNAPGNTIADD